MKESAAGEMPSEGATQPYSRLESAASGQEDRVRVALVAGPTPQLTGEIQGLLRKRMLFGSLFTIMVFAVYSATFLPLFLNLAIGIMYGVMFATTGVLAWVLWRNPSLSLPALRRIELTLLAAIVLFVSWEEGMFFSSDWLPAFAKLGWEGVFIAARSMSLMWVLLIVGYGLAVPNTWRRCALVVGLLSFWRLAMAGAACLWHSGIETHLLLTFFGEAAINTVVAATIAVFGSHRIEVLRQQAFEARKLGQYLLKERLGSGGMGEVYLAEHVLLRRPCAIKLIHPERAGDPRHLLRFEREVRATARLTHPNTVEIFDYGHAADGTFYYVMEHLPGLNLQELVERFGRLPPERAVHFLRQVCAALREAHANDLIHRDIKPSNVIACERGGIHDVAKLLDFGLVQALDLDKQVEKLTQEGAILGTPAYMSPEQAGGEQDLDGRSDIYSIGAVAYFLLTGRPPFAGRSAVQTIAAHLYEAPARLQDCRPELPTDVVEVIMHCLEKDPARRPAGVAALEGALAGCECAGHWTEERAAEWWQGRAGEPIIDPAANTVPPPAWVLSGAERGSQRQTTTDRKIQ